MNPCGFKGRDQSVENIKKEIPNVKWHSFGGIKVLLAGRLKFFGKMMSSKRMFYSEMERTALDTYRRQKGFSTSHLRTDRFVCCVS